MTTLGEFLWSGRWATTEPRATMGDALGENPMQGAA